LIPSSLLSLGAAGLLAWHLDDPARPVDGWAITLLIVGFLPWLRTVFERIDFPGGGSVTWRKAVEKEQQRQAQDIEAVLQFLTANFLPVPECELLQRLASGVSLPLKGDGSWWNLHKRIHPLLDKGLIAENPLSPLTPNLRPQKKPSVSPTEASSASTSSPNCPARELLAASRLLSSRKSARCPARGQICLRETARRPRHHDQHQRGR
jgi:hypothetical protein